jgi:gas vesicle protein
MKKAVVGVAAVGTVVGLLVAAKRVSHEMRKQMKEHCQQMAAHCKEMMASRNGSTEVPSEREVEEITQQTAAAPTS